MFLGVGDLDGNDRSDVLAATNGGPLMLFRAIERETFERISIPLPDNTGTGKGVAIGDIDLDGRNDIVFSTEGAIGNKRGVMWMRAIGPVPDGNWLGFDIAGIRGAKFDRIELLDVDHDQDLDVVTTEEREGLGVI
jgi:hypothetical protein